MVRRLPDGIRASLLLSVALLALFALPAVARASLSWSPAIAVDRDAAGTALVDVACPSTDQCTAIDGAGREITFDPGSPSDPASPSDSSSVTVSVDALTSIACPELTQCTVVDVAGEEVTFDPQSGQVTGNSTVDTSGVPLAVSCPSAQQCTLVDASGGEVTFDTPTGSSISSATVDPSNGRTNGNLLVGIDCPSAAVDCTAVDLTGEYVTFDPLSPGNSTPQTIDNNSPVAISCPSSECLVVDAGGGAATFGPTGESSTTVDGEGSSAVAFSSLACVSSVECVAVDVDGNEATTNGSIETWKKPVVSIDPGEDLVGVSCPAAGQCTAVDRAGQEVTFNPVSPVSPSAPVPVTIDGRSTLAGVACPSGAQCTALDLSGQVSATFDPGADTAPTIGKVDAGTSGDYGLACPALEECVAVDAEGNAVTFVPGTPSSATSTAIDAGQPLYGVACPASTQCTAVDDAGDEVTFNPQSPTAPAPSLVRLEPGHGLLGVSCPTVAQCTAVDDSGSEMTFDPRAPGDRSAHAIDSSPDVALTCPGSSECVAIGTAGEEVTFDPQGGASLVDETIAPGEPLTAIACRTPTDCVATDAAGDVLEGDPRGSESWAALSLDAAGSSLSGVACPSALLCIAVDAPGDAFLGTGGPLPSVPSARSVPTILGTTRQGRSLSAISLGWSPSPTSYVYAWLRCDTSGGRCVPISSALASSYTLGVADVGHTIRAEVAGEDITGAGAPRISAPTAVVRPLLPIRTTGVSLSGIPGHDPVLELAVSAWAGERPIASIALSVSGLSLGGSGSGERNRGIVITSGSRRLTFAVKALGGGRLAISLAHAAQAVRITFRLPALTVTRALERRVGKEGLKSITGSATVIEAGRAQTRLALSVPIS